VVSAKEPHVAERMLRCFENGADISVEASSTMAGCRLASSLLKRPVESVAGIAYHLPGLQANPFKWPRMVYLATYTDEVQTHPGGLADREGVVVFRPNDRKVEDRQMVVDFIRRGLLPVSEFVAEPLPVSKAPEAYANLREQPGRYSSIAFHWKD
jgi:hypothetical protein